MPAGRWTLAHYILIGVEGFLSLVHVYLRRHSSQPASADWWFTQLNLTWQVGWPMYTVVFLGPTAEWLLREMMEQRLRVACTLLVIIFCQVAVYIMP